MSDHDRVIIEFDDENKPEDTIREVLRLIREGYTSGFTPNWEMVKDDEPEDTDKCLSPEAVGDNPERRNAEGLHTGITTLLNSISACDGRCAACALEFKSANKKKGCKKQLFLKPHHFRIQ